MIKERLKEIELKITELSEYLNISRPTMYKFIDSFDNGNRESINQRVLKLFNYLEENPLAGRRATISFILANLTEQQQIAFSTENTDFLPVKKYLTENSESTKSKFIQLAVQKSDFDDIITYLLKIYPLLRKRRLTEEEIALLKPYDDIREIIDNQNSMEEI